MPDARPVPCMQKTVIFFDAAGTLFTVNGSVGERYARLARAYGKDVDVRALEAGFRRSFPNAPPLAFPGAPQEKLEELEKRWWRAVVYDIFSRFGTFPRFEDYFGALYASFARPEAWRLYPETQSTLTTLCERGYRLGVISNFDSRLFDLLDGLGIAERFDPIVASSHADAAKPAAAIFRQALAAADATAEQSVHVGDSYELDVAGARAAGLAAVLVDRGTPARATTDCLVVRRLDEVPALLE